MRPTTACCVLASIGVALGCSAPPDASDAASAEWRGSIETVGDVTTVRNDGGSVWGGTADLVEEVSIDAEGNVYVLSSNEIEIFTQDGAPRATWPISIRRPLVQQSIFAVGEDGAAYVGTYLTREIPPWRADIGVARYAEDGFSATSRYPRSSTTTAIASLTPSRSSTETSYGPMSRTTAAPPS